MGLVPDEAKALPPPAIVNRNSVWLGFVGWSTAMLHNAFCHRPPLKSGETSVRFSTVCKIYIYILDTENRSPPDVHIMIIYQAGV
jgi:hypothetical protein